MERRKSRGVYSLALEGFTPRDIQDDDCPAFALSDTLDEVETSVQSRARHLSGDCKMSSYRYHASRSRLI